MSGYFGRFKKAGPEPPPPPPQDDMDACCDPKQKSFARQYWERLRDSNILPWPPLKEETGPNEPKDEKNKKAQEEVHCRPVEEKEIPKPESPAPKRCPEEKKAKVQKFECVSCYIQMQNPSIKTRCQMKEQEAPRVPCDCTSYRAGSQERCLDLTSGTSGAVPLEAV